jgi:hypothetical protein
MQGHRKHQKVRGGSTFGMKRAPKNFFTEMLATGRRIERRKTKCNHKSGGLEADSQIRSNESDRKN